MKIRALKDHLLTWAKTNDASPRPILGNGGVLETGKSMIQHALDSRGSWRMQDAHG